jgi:hypothetical protein
MSKNHDQYPWFSCIHDKNGSSFALLYSKWYKIILNRMHQQTSSIWNTTNSHIKESNLSSNIPCLIDFCLLFSCFVVIILRIRRSKYLFIELFACDKLFIKFYTFGNILLSKSTELFLCSILTYWQQLLKRSIEFLFSCISKISFLLSHTE